MRILLSLLCLFGCFGNSLGQSNRVGTFTFTQKRSGHTAKVVFKARPFERSRHIVTRKQGCPIIDGRQPLGTDCNIPRVEIESINFFFDGKRVAVPQKLYSDCYEPTFDARNLAIKIGDDLQSVFVFMHGSDGAGVYDVAWVLRKNGQHARVSNAGGDCGFFNFDCGIDNR